MTLVSEIIRDAYRESNLIAISADPTADEIEEGLRFLNRLVSSVYGNEAGDQLQPIVIGRNNIDRPQGFPWYDQVPDQTDWFVPQNVRMVLNLTEPQTVWLDPNPQDGQRFGIQDKSGNLASFNFTIEGNGRTIDNDQNLVINTNGANMTFMYRQDTGDWAIVTPLLISDTFPFPPEFDDMFIIGLAMRLNPRHAVEVDPQSVQAYQRSFRQFGARYQQVAVMFSELGLIRTKGNQEQYFDDTRLGNSLFNSGYAMMWGGYRW